MEQVYLGGLDNPVETLAEAVDVAEDGDVIFLVGEENKMKKLSWLLVDDLPDPPCDGGEYVKAEVERVIKETFGADIYEWMERHEAKEEYWYKPTLKGEG